MSLILGHDKKYLQHQTLHCSSRNIDGTVTIVNNESEWREQLPGRVRFWIYHRALFNTSKQMF